MLPSAEAFAAAMDALGISNSDHVVVYDCSGLFSAARAWWMLRAFGATSNTPCHPTACVRGGHARVRSPRLV